MPRFRADQKKFAVFLLTIVTVETVMVAMVMTHEHRDAELAMERGKLLKLEEIRRNMTESDLTDSDNNKQNNNMNSRILENLIENKLKVESDTDTNSENRILENLIQKKIINKNNDEIYSGKVLRKNRVKPKPTIPGSKNKHVIQPHKPLETDIATAPTVNSHELKLKGKRGVLPFLINKRNKS